MRDFKYNNRKSKFAQHLLDNGHAIGDMDEIMKIIHVTKKGRMLNTLESFHIYKETKAGNKINHKLTTRENAIFEAILKHDPQRDTAPPLQNTPVKIAQSCETIHPGTEEGTLQKKGQEPDPTDHRSEGPY